MDEPQISGWEILVLGLSFYETYGGFMADSNDARSARGDRGENVSTPTYT